MSPVAQTIGVNVPRDTEPGASVAPGDSVFYTPQPSDNIQLPRCVAIIANQYADGSCLLMVITTTGIVMIDKVGYDPAGSPASWNA